MHRRIDAVLSLDELESVSGGFDRDWLKDGCAATVEPKSWCDSNDSCIWWDVTYDHEPANVICPKCGAFMYVNWVDYDSTRQMILTTINAKTAELRNRTEQTMTGVLDSLAAEYPQLYLNPDADTQETYRRVVLQGGEPEERNLGHYVGDQHDHMETADWKTTRPSQKS